MINQESIDAFEKSRFGNFHKPLYDSYCFSRIPATISSFLGVQSEYPLPETINHKNKYDFVIFILLDGFGWNLFEKYKERFPFLHRFLKQGQVNLLSSMFPSTTCGHITCLHTGLSGGMSGLYEWYIYEPLVQAPIIPMRFSLAYDKKPNTLGAKGYTPESLFGFPTFYQKLQEQNITSYVFQPKDITNSPYSNALQKGAENISYKTLREGLKKLQRTYEQTTATKGYFFFYYPEIDSYSHCHGIDAPELEKELIHCFSELERFFETLCQTKKRGCLLVGADHGLTNCDPKKRLYVNKSIPELSALVESSPNNTPIVPCGSSRDFFLHIKPEFLQKAKYLLENELKDTCKVYLTTELISEGLFGIVSQRFLDRVGNLVILPNPPFTVWWHDARLPHNDYLGHHGGLSHDELAIPFLLLDL